MTDHENIDDATADLKATETGVARIVDKLRAAGPGASPYDALPELFDDEDEQESPEELRETADAFLALSRMAEERGLARISELGDLPPLDPKEKARLLSPDWRPPLHVVDDKGAESEA